MALTVALVTQRKIVGPGFTWLGGATSLMIGIWPALGGEVVATAASVLALTGTLSVKPARQLSTTSLFLAGLLFLWAAWGTGNGVLAVTATVALGGITGEMLLGHWYLVDPTLPRAILSQLAVAGGVAIALDALAAGWLLGWPTGFGAAIVWILVITTSGLMAAVVGALRYPAYSGVMAATGLSYLAVLTGLGVVFVGRIAVTSGIF